MTESVACTRQGAIATITLNTPEGMNALDCGMWQRIGDLIFSAK